MCSAVWVRSESFPISLENTWQEIRDHSSIQTLSRSFRFPDPCWCFFSSVQTTHQVKTLGRSWQKLHFVLPNTFLCWFWCLFWIVVLMEDSTTAHYTISSRRHQVLIFYLYFHNALSEQEVQDLQQKNMKIWTWKIQRSTHLVCFFFKFHLTTEACPVWRSSRVWHLNLLEFVGWARSIFFKTLPNNMWWYSFF